MEFPDRCVKQGTGNSRSCLCLEMQLGKQRQGSKSQVARPQSMENFSSWGGGGKGLERAEQTPSYRELSRSKQKLRNKRPESEQDRDRRLRLGLQMKVEVIITVL